MYVKLKYVYTEQAMLGKASGIKYYTKKNHEEFVEVDSLEDFSRYLYRLYIWSDVNDFT